MSGPIMVAGAINTDLVASVDRAPKAGETVTGSSFAMYSGGKGANQAVAAARSGAPVVMLGAVGQDDFGTARRADLAMDHVDTSRIATLASASSGVALIIVESSGENRICYIPAATLQVPRQYCIEAIEAVTPTRLLATNELSSECLRPLLGWARHHGVPTIFNAAPFSDEVVNLLHLVDVLIVNRGEAAAILGMRGDEVNHRDAAVGLRAAGCKDVVITLGSGGAYALAETYEVSEPAMKVKVVDTTGAGDTFCGALAARSLYGASLREAIRYANVAGALATTRHGAQPSIPTKADVEGAMA